MGCFSSTESTSKVFTGQDDQAYHYFFGHNGARKLMFLSDAKGAGYIECKRCLDAPRSHYYFPRHVFVASLHSTECHVKYRCENANLLISTKEATAKKLKECPYCFPKEEIKTVKTRDPPPSY